MSFMLLIGIQYEPYIIEAFRLCIIGSFDFFLSLTQGNIRKHTRTTHLQHISKAILSN